MFPLYRYLPWPASAAGSSARKWHWAISRWPQGVGWGLRSSPAGYMQALSTFATNFIGVFNAGGTNLVGLITGILPTLLVLLTFVNALVRLIGEKRVMGFAQKCTKYAITRYTIFPILAMFFLTNPMAYTFGRFLDEKYKPAFYDTAVSFCHPITGLFPHDRGELARKGRFRNVPLHQFFQRSQPLICTLTGQPGHSFCR